MLVNIEDCLSSEGLRRILFIRDLYKVLKENNTVEIQKLIKDIELFKEVCKSLAVFLKEQCDKL